MPRFKLRTLFWFVAICAVGSCTVMSFQDRVTYNAAREDVWLQLPNDATRINHFQPGAFDPNSYFEFDTSEKSFLDWVGEYSNVTRLDRAGPYATMHTDPMPTPAV
jgi:hypothetical protein